MLCARNVSEVDVIANEVTPAEWQSAACVEELGAGSRQFLVERRCRAVPLAHRIPVNLPAVLWVKAKPVPAITLKYFCEPLVYELTAEENARVLPLRPDGRVGHVCICQCMGRFIE